MKAFFLIVAIGTVVPLLIWRWFIEPLQCVRCKKTLRPFLNSVHTAENGMDEYCDPCWAVYLRW